MCCTDAQTYTLKIGSATINDVQHEWQKRWGACVKEVYDLVVQTAKAKR